MRWRYAFYFCLLIVPITLGQRNVQIHGDFAPAFIAGLIPVLVLIVLIELVLLIVRKTRAR
jgi:hypothetical protein